MNYLCNREVGGRLIPERWEVVRGESMEQAALKYALSFHPRKGSLTYVFVAEPGGPVHDNGSPMCVRRASVEMRVRA